MRTENETEIEQEGGDEDCLTCDGHHGSGRCPESSAYERGLHLDEVEHRAFIAEQTAIGELVGHMLCAQRCADCGVSIPADQSRCDSCSDKRWSAAGFVRE